MLALRIIGRLLDDTGHLAEQAGVGDATRWRRKAYDVLIGMKRRGLFLSAEDEQFLTTLRAKVGG